MVAAVWYQEFLRGVRRGRLWLFGWAYVGWLVLQLFFFFLQFEGEEHVRLLTRWQAVAWSDIDPSSGFLWRSAPEVVGARFAEAFVPQQLLLLALATPALVAGAVTDEKRRGTLQCLLTADLGARPLLVGKLLARLAQVGLLALTGLPLFALMAGFGGVEPLTLLLVLVAPAVPAFAVGSAALLASVWCRQTRDAVLAVYVLGVAAGLAVWGLGGPGFLDPRHVVAPAWGPGRTADYAEALGRLVLSVLAWGTLGGVCLTVAVWRLRPAYVRELESPRPRRPAWAAAVRPPVDDAPVAWRERHVEGLAPAPALRRIPTPAALAGVALLSAVSSLTILVWSLPAGGAGALGRALARRDPVRLAATLPDAREGFLVQGVVVMLLASLVVGVRCSGAVTGERERGTWEALLLTPLSARELVRGKLWGVMGAGGWYLLAYAAPAALLAALGGPLSVFWVLVWLAVTALAMYFVGAAGMWCSVRSANSWQSLLKTLGWGYLAGAAVYVATSPVILVLAVIVLLVVLVADRVFGTSLASGVVRVFGIPVPVLVTASCLSLAAVFWLLSRLFLKWAERWVADRERTRHWNEVPAFRRPRRAAAPRTIP
jgi:ABC-type transport system involved in multi-copper enzyme maturation permease subunit